MEREKKLEWKWVGDCCVGQHTFSVWDRYDNFRWRYAITQGRSYPQPEEEGQPGPKWRVIAQLRAKYPYAQFCWIAVDYERAIHSF